MTETMREALEALELAEDVLSRAPFSTAIWPNGVHPQSGITKIRDAIAALQSSPQTNRDTIEAVIGNINSNEPHLFMQWDGGTWRTYYSGFDLTDFSLRLLAALDEARDRSHAN